MERKKHVTVHPDVTDALEHGRAVVALESTIISHGMPYPQNVETARTVEEIVRSGGAVPATIAIMDGAFQIGLFEDQIERLGTTRDVMKASRRDVGLALATKRIAATTVATTMIGAAAAGIRLFATGGTGGVHRGYQTSLDVSADLPELGRTPVAVVSAGVKSILDIGRTLEYLETLGVPVITVGADDFPAFYSRTSGFTSPLRLDSPESIAGTLLAHWSIDGAGGALVANPIPEGAAIDYQEIEAIIQRAVGEAEAQGVMGKRVTPFLLSRIVELTGGASLNANIALVKNNARLATEIAVALARLG
jgi:pseudouridylate synthase